jgi:hypothetical protein
VINSGLAGDACSIVTQAVLANDYASAVMQFCIDLVAQGVQSTITTQTHFYVSDTINSIKIGALRGLVGASSVNLARLVAQFATTCTEDSITF